MKSRGSTLIEVIVVLAVISIIALIAISNVQIKEPQKIQGSKAEEIFAGEHRLRKLAVETNLEGKVSERYFLFIGGLEGTVKTISSVKFAWQMNDGTYAISSLPIEKIRVNLDESAEAPTIKFRWQAYHALAPPLLENLMKNNVMYVVVTVKESDWPMHIEMPLGGTSAAKAQ